jgi:hypothetical protein
MTMLRKGSQKSSIRIEGFFRTKMKRYLLMAMRSRKSRDWMTKVWN